MLKRIVRLGLIFMLFLVGVAHANTIWMPTESGAIDINYSWGSEPWWDLSQSGFAILDDTADPNDPAAERLLITDPTPVTLPEIKFYSDTISFMPSGSDWVIQSSESGNSITLSDSFLFQVVVNFDGGWVEPSFYQTAQGQYILMGPDEDWVLQVDAKPVPLPSAVMLLGSGLLGLMGYCGYRNRSK